MRVCALVAFCMAWAAFWATGIHPVLESWASCLIDAARLVVQAVRKLCAEGRAAAPLRGVLAHHDRLVASHEPPSEWATKEGG